MIQSKLYELITTGKVMRIDIIGETNNYLNVYLKDAYNYNFTIYLENDVEEIVDEKSSDFQYRNNDDEKVRVVKVFKNEYELYNEIVWEINKINAKVQAERTNEEKFVKEVKEIDKLKTKMDTKLRKEIVKVNDNFDKELEKNKDRWDKEIVNDVRPLEIGKNKKV